MKITREALKNIVKETMIEESEYQEFFKKALEKAGKSIPSMSDEEKKKFFNNIEKTWKGKGAKQEQVSELTDAQKKLPPALQKAIEKKEDKKDGKDESTDDKNESINEGKFKVDDLVYNKRTKTVGIVRIADGKDGEAKTDADGNVNVDELEKYNPIKFKHQSKAKAAPSTQKEVSKRGLFNPFKNESVNEDQWRNTRIQSKNIFRMLKQKYNNNIPKMEKGLETVLKQNKTKNDQAEIVRQEFKKYFKIKESIIKEGFAVWEMSFADMNLNGVKLSKKNKYKVKARNTVEAIKKAAKMAGLKGNDWIATQTNYLKKIG